MRMRQSVVHGVTRHMAGLALAVGKKKNASRLGSPRVLQLHVALIYCASLVYSTTITKPSATLVSAL